LLCPQQAQLDPLISLDHQKNGLEAGGWRLEAGGWRLELDLASPGHQIRTLLDFKPILWTRPD